MKNIAVYRRIRDNTPPFDCLECKAMLAMVPVAERVWRCRECAALFGPPASLRVTYAGSRRRGVSR